MVLRTRIIRKFFASLQFVLLLATYNGGADAFCTFGSGVQGTCQHHTSNVVKQGQCSALRTPLNNNRISMISTASRKTQRFLVSEDDVIEAVERAETLWAEALEARKEANALVDRAEEEANASAGTAKEAENIFADKSKPVSMEQLVQVDNAAKASLEATCLVNEAMKASEAADKLEAEAEEALRKSEEILDQHLIDYPNSSLAD